MAGYGAVKGRPTAGAVRGPGTPPHYHIQIEGGSEGFDAAVNVASKDPGSQVLFYVNQAFTPADPAGLTALAPGFTALPGGIAPAVDFIRQNLVTRDEMTLVALTETPEGSSLHDAIDDMVQRAIQDADATLYVFGVSFPGGIHNVHMNQGNPPGGGFSDENGIFQDGAIFGFYPSENVWRAAFLAFTTEVWTTDDQGNPVT